MLIPFVEQERQFQMGFSSSIWTDMTQFKRIVPNGVSKHVLA
jgi:hypothetical protein